MLVEAVDLFLKAQALLQQEEAVELEVVVPVAQIQTEALQRQTRAVAVAGQDTRLHPAQAAPVSSS
jgi:hypothetical protein